MERYREEIPANRPGEQNNVCVGERERERVGADDPLEEKSRWVDEKQQIWEAEERWWEILTLSSKDLKPFNAPNTHTHTRWQFSLWASGRPLHAADLSAAD